MNKVCYCHVLICSLLPNDPYFSLNIFIFRDGNSSEIAAAGSLHAFLQVLHKRFGPIASFWWKKMYTVSIASAELFEEQKDIFNRPSESHLI